MKELSGIRRKVAFLINHFFKKDSCSFASYGKVSSGRGKRWQLAMLFPASHAACTIAMRPVCSNEVCILSFHRKTSLNKEDTNTATKLWAQSIAVSHLLGQVQTWKCRLNHY